MKAVIRVFNVVIMLMSAVATVLLFTTPTFTLNSNVALSVDFLNSLVPANDYTGTLDIKSILGTESINFAIKFDFDLREVNSALNRNKEVINNMVFKDNVNEIADTMYQPVDIITEYAVRTVIKKVVKDEITNQVENILTDAAIADGSTAQDIMDEVGMNDAYFTSFAKNMYDSANEDNATVGSFTNALYWQVDEAVQRAANNPATAGQVDESKFGDEQKSVIKNNFMDIFKQLKLVNEDPSIPEDDQTLVKISFLAYVYLSSTLKTQLETKVEDPSVLNQLPSETVPVYAKRLTNLYVQTMMPEVFYQIVGYASLGLFIALFVFAFIWALLFLITLIKTFTSKPWTIFGPWFWIIGSLQVVLGIGITVVGKFVLPKYVSLIPAGSPIKSFVIVPRTFALIPSMIFLGAIVFAIVYAILRSKAKKEYRASKEGVVK